LMRKTCMERPSGRTTDLKQVLSRQSFQLWLNKHHYDIAYMLSTFAIVGTHLGCSVWWKLDD